MKVAISYPPISKGGGTPLLAQNRQFQWFNAPTYIYPMVPAYAATLLRQEGHEVVWDDGIAEEKTYEQWLKGVVSRRPEIIALETKTPLVKRHWRIIDDLKRHLPDTRVVLMGDHVTALPLESFEKSKVDAVLTGGDFDFLLLNLVRWLDGRGELEPGIFYRDSGYVKSTGEFRLTHDLNSLPFIDRELTNWRLYAYKNGNFKRTPGTYTMVGRDCWWRKDGGCTFCAWTQLYPNFRVRKPELLVGEVEFLVERYKVREVFDDTGTFPAGGWLRKFCRLAIERRLGEKVYLGCNMRFGACTFDDYKLMKRAGFRMLLFGLESASQETLSKINKGLTVEEIVDSCRLARLAGLEPHLTIMVGYPWESKEEVWETFNLAKKLFERGWAHTLQATLMVPYPGTKMFQYCRDNGLLTTLDWNDYDMRRLVTKSPLGERDVKEITQAMYKLFFNPKYMLRRLCHIRRLEDLSFIGKGFIKVIAHIKDFTHESGGSC
ncbi:MAG: radical SAM protein [Candidatus Bathyarchaeia archaeon]